MPSFFDQSDRHSLLARIDQLRPDAPARFGKFNAPRMVCHLIESMRMASGDLVPRPKRRTFPRVVSKFIIHYLPWPKGAPTAPELLAHPPASWDSDLAMLRGLVERHPYPPADAALPSHPAFGPLDRRDWGVLMYRHLDHHLSQFGC